MIRRDFLKVAVDIALHDLIDTPDVVRQKTRECADRFRILKVKVGLDNDKEMIINYSFQP